MEYYWEIVHFDGRLIEVVPSAVNIIRKRWDAGEPIHLPTESIAAHQIKDLRQTSKPYGVPLLEAAAQAFKTPQYTDGDETNGGIVARWVKKGVTSHEWAKHYSAIPSYKKLSSEGGIVMVAFLQAIHDIDTALVSYCTDEEEAKLWQGRG